MAKKINALSVHAQKENKIVIEIATKRIKLRAKNAKQML